MIYPSTNSIYKNINSSYSKYEKQKDKNVSFQGLNRYFAKKFIYTHMFYNYETLEETLLTVVNKYPKSRRFLGNLPHDWIEKISPEKRKESVIKIQDLFAELAKQTSSPRDAKQNIKHAAKGFCESLDNLLGTAGTTIKYIKSGYFGKAYKLSVNDRHYVFKSFHSDIEEVFFKDLGPMVETIKAPFVKKTTSAFADFYFGKFATKKENDGFLLIKYENEIKKPKSPKLLIPFIQNQIMLLLKILRAPVTSEDIKFEIKNGVISDKNIVGTKIVDYGRINRQWFSSMNQLKQQTKDLQKECFIRKKQLVNIDKTIKTLMEMKLLLEENSLLDNLKNVPDKLSVLIIELNKTKELLLQEINKSV